MSDPKFKAGDKVICKDEGYSRHCMNANGEIIERVRDGVWQVMVDIAVEGIKQRLTFYEGDLELIQPSPPPSEIDAIERDMADLFARMRAAIERLK